MNHLGEKYSWSNNVTVRHTSYRIVIAIALASFASAQTESIGGAAGAAFRMGFGARGTGMGNALSAVPSGKLSAYYNPSLLPFQSAPVLSATYGLLTLDRRLNFFSYTKNLKPNAGISLSIINAGVGKIQGRDRDGTPTELLSTSENAFGLSFGIQPLSEFSLGVTAKILYFSLYKDVSSTTVGLDFGISYFLSDVLTISAVLQDVNSKYKWDTAKIYGARSGNATTDLFPVRKRIAASYHEPGLGIIVSTEFESVGSAGFARIGAEWSATGQVVLRAGWDQISFSRSVDSKPAFGFSLSQSVAGWMATFEYAFVLEPYASSGFHVFGLNVRID